MVWPATNCSPIRRMAMLTPVRIKGSPPRPIRRTSADDRLCSLLVAVSRPVSIKPQVAAFTNSDGLWPRWARQSPPPILSRISASRVSSSGMRSSASARHISATPSWLDSAYSWISPSTPPDGVFSRSASTSRVASVRARAVRAGVSFACSIRGGRHSVSGRRQAAVMAARSGVCRWIDCAKA